MKKISKLLATAVSAVMAMSAMSATSLTANAVTYKCYASLYGNCRVTAYSGTNGVTYGASGNTLVPNVSVAASRNIPLGTQLYIEDFGIVTVEDRTAKWYDDEHDGMIIDLYLDSYDSACQWGVHNLDVYIIDEIEIVDD